MNTVDGKLAALTFGSNTHAFIFEETLSEKYGVATPKEGYSWDDLTDYSTAIAEADGGAVWARLISRPAIRCSKSGPSSRERISSPRTALDSVRRRLRTSGSTGRIRAKVAVPSPDVSTEYLATPYDAVLQGVVASTFLFTNQFATVADSTPNELSITRMPGETPTPGQYLRAAMNLTVSAKSEHPEAAARLVDFLLNDEEANAILGTDRGFPSNENVFEAATADLDGPAAAGAEIFDAVRADGSPAPVPAPAGSGAVNTLFSEVAQKIQFGQLSVSEGASEFLSQAEAALG